MTEQITFIHAADLHLGAPFRGLRELSDVWAQKLLKALSEAYNHVIEAALSRKVDFVVIAGDIFDSAHPSYGDYVRFFEGLKKLEEANIPVYLVAGNHDPYTSWKSAFFSLPSNTVLLPSDRSGFALYERDGRPLCIIGGRGYYNHTWPVDECIAEGITRTAAEQALALEYPSVGAAPFAVGVLHTGLNIDRSKAPVDPSVLYSAGMDYWALGHVHARHVYPSFDNPRLAFSGCIQGRDIKETGERGVYHVTLTEGAPNKIEAIPTAHVVWQQMHIDIADCTNLLAVTDKIMRELFRENSKAHCEEMIVRVTLEGATALHTVLGRDDVIADMRKQLNESYSAFFCDALIDATVEPRDKRALMQEGLFPAVFLQVSAAQRAKPDDEITYLQNEFLAKNIQLPRACTHAVNEIACEAENLVLDLLSQGD